MAKKAGKKASRPKGYRYDGKNRRKGPRTVHVIDEHTTARDFELAKSDLEGFFLGVLDKHHGF